MNTRYDVRTGRVQRTSWSINREILRRTMKQTSVKFAALVAAARGFAVRTAQDVADEAHLSRSKVYLNKGRREASRRLAQQLIGALR